MFSACLSRRNVALYDCMGWETKETTNKGILILSILSILFVLFNIYYNSISFVRKHTFPFFQKKKILYVCSKKVTRSMRVTKIQNLRKEVCVLRQKKKLSCVYLCVCYKHIIYFIIDFYHSGDYKQNYITR